MLLDCSISISSETHHLLNFRRIPTSINKGEITKDITNWRNSDCDGSQKFLSRGVVRYTTIDNVFLSLRCLTNIFFQIQLFVLYALKSLTVLPSTHKMKVHIT